METAITKMKTSFLNKSILAVSFVLILSVFFFFKDINSYPLKNWDEAWYAEETRNMVSGNYNHLVSFWNGRYYFDKPPLYSWLSLPIFWLFGPPAGGGEWQARAVSASSGVLATLFVFLLAKKLFGPTAGGFASIIFLTLGQVVERISGGNLDGLLVFVICASFYSYLLSLENRSFIFISGFFLGLGFLTKGFFPGLFPVFVILVDYFVRIKRKDLRVFLAPLVGLLIYFLWFIPSYLKFGKDFFDWFTFGQSTSQFNWFIVHGSLFVDLARDLGLWWAVALSGLVVGRKLLVKHKEIFISFLVSIAIYLASIFFLREYYGWYLLPTYPFIAIMVGSIASSLLKSNASKLFLAGILAVVIAQLLLVERIRSIHPDRSLLIADLGKSVKEIVPKEETLFLNDNDFSSFLYYYDFEKAPTWEVGDESNSEPQSSLGGESRGLKGHGRFYSERGEVIVLRKGGGKEGEWWIKDEGYFSNMIAEGKRVWLVTADIKKLDFDVTRLSEIRGLGEFKLVKFN